MKRRLIVISSVIGFLLLIVALWGTFIGFGEDVVNPNCGYFSPSKTKQQSTTSCTQMSPEQQELLNEWKKTHPVDKEVKGSK